MGCLIYSLEKLSDGKRRAFFYATFLLGGLLTTCGIFGFVTPHKGWAFIVVSCGIFILITTGILWDTMAHPVCMPQQRTSSTPSAPREEDDPPPDYDSVVTNGKTLSRSNSKWSLHNQSWCPSFNPKFGGYGKTATSECTEIVTDLPPTYTQARDDRHLQTQSSTASSNGERQRDASVSGEIKVNIDSRD